LQLRSKFPKLGALMDDAEHDVLAFMTSHARTGRQSYSTNPLERLNAEIKRRTNVVGVFPNDASITRLVGAMMWLAEYRASQLSPGCGPTPQIGTRPKPLDETLPFNIPDAELARLRGRAKPSAGLFHALPSTVARYPRGHQRVIRRHAIPAGVAAVQSIHPAPIACCLENR
jgi:hypothetical protein